MANKPICDQDTPDPWMISWNGRYYLTFTLGNRVEIWCSSRMEDFRNCEKSIVWQPPPNSEWSADLWAPELHNLNGIWYIYFCGAPPSVGNHGHRTLLLRSNNNHNPLDASSWHFLGPLPGLPDSQWSIDATICIIKSQLYLCYSGWPLNDHSDTQQDLFLIQLHDPEHADPATLTCISRAQLPWERPDNGKRGVNEGPTFLSLPPSQHHPHASGFQGIIYSAHGSWTSDYKLAILALINPSDPCNESSWVKRSVPLLVSDEQTGCGPFGPGHASFLPCPWDDEYVLCIYHGTERKDEGWANRKARVMSLHVGAFTAQAGPVCCAGVPVSGSQGQSGGVAGGFPGAGNNSQQPGHAQGQGGGFGGKLGAEFEKRIPGQYRGVYDKMKRFF